MQHLLIRGMMVDWGAVAKKAAFQIRELRVRQYLKDKAGKSISLDSIADCDLRKDVRQYLIDLKDYLEKNKVMGVPADTKKTH